MTHFRIGTGLHTLFHRRREPQEPSRTPGVVFDRAQQAVGRGQAWIPLPPIAARILAYLVEHPDCIVPEATLIRVGWEGAPRGAADLYKQIYRLRQVLEADPHRPDRLLTRRGAGYLLVGVQEVHRVPAVGKR